MAETADKTKASATRESGKVDALALLEADHRAVEKLFDAFERAGSDLEAKAALAQRACEELGVHTMIGAPPGRPPRCPVATSLTLTKRTLSTIW
jgi:hypothetical protein